MSRAAADAGAVLDILALGVPGRLVGGVWLYREEPSMLAGAHRVLWVVTDHRYGAGRLAPGLGGE